MKISIVTPLYRSAPYIEELHRRCVATIASIGSADYEIIFVNDASPDDSLSVARRVAEGDPHVRVIDLSRNFGQHPAALTGLAQASGDYAFVLDSDLEDDPEWLALFLEAMRSRDCDVVYGINTNQKGGFLYTRLRRLFYRTLTWLSGVDFPANVCSARLMSRRYVDALLQFRESQVFMAGIWHMAGFTQMPVEVVKRDSSPTTYSTRRLIGIFVNAVTAFSVRPLMAISVAGILLSIAAFLFTLWVVFQKLLFGIAIQGWASVMAAVLIIGGLSLFFNGIMAIYIAKIFLEVKQRPRTIVKSVFQQGAEPGGPPQSGSGQPQGQKTEERQPPVPTVSA